MSQPKFKVGDLVIIRNDETDQENQSRLSDLQSDMQQDLTDRSLTGRAYDAFFIAIEKGRPFTVTAVVTGEGEDDWPVRPGDEPCYELKLKNRALGYRMEESQLKPAP